MASLAQGLIAATTGTVCIFTGTVAVAAPVDTASAAASFLKTQVNEDGSYDLWSSWEGNTSSYKGYGQLIDALLAFKATGEENSTEA